jgi:hypothetical protein
MIAKLGLVAVIVGAFGVGCSAKAGEGGGSAAAASAETPPSDSSDSNDSSDAGDSSDSGTPSDKPSDPGYILCTAYVGNDGVQFSAKPVPAESAPMPADDHYLDDHQFTVGFEQGDQYWPTTALSMVTDGKVVHVVNPTPGAKYEYGGSPASIRCGLSGVVVPGPIPPMDPAALQCSVGMAGDTRTNQEVPAFIVDGDMMTNPGTTSFNGHKISVVFITGGTRQTLQLVIDDVPFTTTFPGKSVFEFSDGDGTKVSCNFNR